MNQDSKSRTTGNKPEQGAAGPAASLVEPTPAKDHDSSEKNSGTTGGEASTAKQERKTGGRYGKHSPIETVGTVEYEWCDAEDAEQNAIRWIGSVGTSCMDRKIDIKPQAVTFSDCLTLPELSGRTARRTYTSSVPLVYETGGTFKPFAISWSGSRVKASYDSVVGIPPDYDLVISWLGAIVCASETVKGGIFHSVRSGSPFIADMSGFFTIAYMYAMHLDICAENEIKVNRRPYNPDNFVFLDLAVSGEAERDVASRWKEAAEEFLIFIRDAPLSSAMRELLIVLTLGGPDADPPVAGQPISPITSAYTYPTLRFAIWDDKEPIEWPGRVQITAEDARSAIKGFATILGADDDHSIGFCRASTFLITRVVHLPSTPENRDKANTVDEAKAMNETIGELGNKLCQIGLSARASNEASSNIQGKGEVGSSSNEAGGQNRPVDQCVRTIVTGLLEVGGSSLHRPIGINPLYDWLKIARPPGATNIHLHKDGLFLYLRGDHLVKVQFFLGAALSVVASSTFDLGNFTARELNNWACCKGAPSCNVLNQILLCSPGSDRAKFYDFVAGSVMQLYHYKLNRFAIGAVGNWSTIILPNNADSSQTLWQGSWGRNVPYIIRPETQAWQYVGWADIWGITGNGPRVDFRQDFIPGSPGREAFYLFSQNEPQYQESAASSAPYMKVNYGLFMCSMFWQLTRTLPMARVSFRRIRRSLRLDEDPGWYTDAYQPQLEEDQFRFVPGTFPSYDWVEERVLVPGFRVDDCDKNSFWWASQMSNNIRWVGVLREHEVPFGCDYFGGMKGVRRPWRVLPS